MSKSKKKTNKPLPATNTSDRTVWIEMLYDDFDPKSQQTPSRVECFLCRTPEAAEKVAAKLMAYIESACEPEIEAMFNIYVGAKPKAYTFARARSVIDDMLLNYGVAILCK